MQPPKKSIALRLALAAGVAAAATLAMPELEAQVQNLPAKTGRVVYKMSSKLISGTMTFVWSENGKKFRQDTDAIFSQSESSTAPTMPMKSWTMGDGVYAYTHVPLLGPKQVNRIKVSKDAKGGALAGLPTASSQKSFGKVVGKETILGKPCEVRVQGPTKIAFWQNLPMRMNVTQNGMTLDMVATKLQLNAPVNASMFKVPAGMKIVDGAIKPPTDGGPGARPLPRKP